MTSLLESRSADTGTDFFRKVIGYWIHGTRVRFGYSSLLLSPSLPILAVSTALVVSTTSAVSTVSSLVPVTGIEIVETNTSFLTFGDNVWRNGPFSDSCSTRLGRNLSPPS